MARQGKEPAIQAEHLRFRYFPQNKKNILEDCSITAPQGKITVLMGRSGCGKSTLAALLAGLYPENGGILESGKIRIFGEEIDRFSFPERAGKISMMFQNPDLQFCMKTLRKEMQFCLENVSCPPEEMEGRIQEAAVKTGMTEMLDRELFTLSGGEKQKAELTCIFLLGSKIILLDEPFANIDVSWAFRLRDLLLQKNREDGTTIVVIDHRLDYWIDCFDELKVMKEDGQILEGITRESLPDEEGLFQSEGLRWPLETHGKSSEGSSGQRLPVKESAGQHLPDREPGAANFSAETSFLSDREKKPEEKDTDKSAVDPGESREDPLPISLLSAGIYPGKKKNKKTAPILEGAYASFREGIMTAVVGPSGCGKTTLFRTLLGQQKYDGSIRIRGRELKTIASAALFQKIGIVFQNPSNQFVTQNVLQEVEEGLKERERDPAQREKHARELLREFHLERYARYSPYMLSQGQQRRLAVLAILSGTQKILLLDEPTYGQDDAMTREIMTLLRRRVQEESLTVIFTTHDPSVVREWADVCYLVRGKKLEERRRECFETGELESVL